MDQHDVHNVNKFPSYTYYTKYTDSTQFEKQLYFVLSSKMSHCATYQTCTQWTWSKLHSTCKLCSTLTMNNYSISISLTKFQVEFKVIHLPTALHFVMHRTSDFVRCDVRARSNTGWRYDFAKRSLTMVGLPRNVHS